MKRCAGKGLEGQSLPRRGSIQNPIPLFLLPTVSGILAWLSFPKPGYGYLAWVSLTPLLCFLVRVRRCSSAFAGGQLAGMVMFFGMLYWIPQTLVRYGGLPTMGAWSLFLLMVSILGCFPAAACLLTRYCMNRSGSRLLLLFAPAWISLEYLRSLIPFGGFPWLTMGYSQSSNLRIIQIADLSGVLGVSLLILWVNVALAWSWAQRENLLRSIAPGIIALLLLVGCLAYGSSALRRWGQIEPDFRAALLQGNLSLDEPESTLRWKYQEGYEKMAAPLAAQNIDLLILPESPSPVFYQNDQTYRNILRDIAARFRLGLIFNNIFFQDIQGNSRYFNSAFFLNQDGTEAGRYDKIHLVPFGEYVPLPKIFFFSDTISKDVGDFHAGNEYNTVRLGGYPINAIICFEAIFPDLARKFVLRGSQLIVNLTNDGWYGDTAAPYQHLEMARWRAVESRRYLLRAANSGISAIVEPSGRIQVQTGLLRQDTALGRFALLTEITFYTRHGEYCPILCVTIVGVVLCMCSWRRHSRQPYPASS